MHSGKCASSSRDRSKAGKAYARLSGSAWELQAEGHTFYNSAGDGADSCAAAIVKRIEFLGGEGNGRICRAGRSSQVKENDSLHGTQHLSNSHVGFWAARPADVAVPYGSHFGRRDQADQVAAWRRTETCFYVLVFLDQPELYESVGWVRIGNALQ